MASDKASNKKQPRKPKPPLPSEDPSLMLKTSSNQPEIPGDINVSGGDVVFGDKIIVIISKMFKLTAPNVITCLSLIIGLLVVLYFLIRYLGS